MTKKMNAKTILFAFALSLFTLSASAQNEQRQGRRQRMSTTEMYTRNAERLVKQMKLEDEKKDLFTVLYLDYMNARQNAANPKGETEGNERIDAKKLTDEEAKALIEKQFAKAEAQNKVDQEYYARFLEMLTPKQAAYIFVPQLSRGAMMNGERPQGMGRGGFGGGGFGPGGFGGGGFGGGDFGGGGF